MAPPLKKMGIVLVVWYTVLLLFLLRNRNAEESVRCIRSHELITVLEYVPYKVRATDLDGVIATMNKRHNADVLFFETDWRTTDRFSLSIVNGSALTGDTNYVSYRIALNDPSEYSFSCMKSFNNFKFV